MSAKHKRPFVVFAAVALICGMVLVTGVRSKAEMSRAPDHFSATVATDGQPITPIPEAGGSTPSDSGRQAEAASQDGAVQAPDTSGSSDFEASLSGGDGRSGEPDSGLVALPPTIPWGPDPVDLDPGPGDESWLPDHGPGTSSHVNTRGDRPHDGKRDGKRDDSDEDAPSMDEGGHPTQPQGEELSDELAAEGDVDVADGPPLVDGH